MRKIFFCIGVFCVVFLFSLGFYGSYQISLLKEEMQELESVRPNPQVMEAESQSVGNGFYLKNDNGKVHVYRGDGKTVYEYTNIDISTLPEGIQKEIENGKFIKSEVELYSFLENYSS